VIPAPTWLGEIVRGLKTFSARRINILRGTPGIPVWQRNFHDRVLRNDHELEMVREYIAGNPGAWETDENHPRRV
jgi:putative transposase